MGKINDILKFGWRIFEGNQTPSIPPNEYKSSGLWTANTELYIGEIAVNIDTEQAWFRTTSGIKEIGGGGTSELYERKFDYVSSALTSYQGYAVSGSSTSDSVWTITKSEMNLIGTVTGNTQTSNYVWDNRYTL